MSDLRTELKQKWEEARHTDPAGHEWRAVALRAQAPVRFLAGVREPDGRLSLLVEAPLASAQKSLFRLQAVGISVVDQRRPEEGIFRLAITLEAHELGDVFEVLATDVIETALREDSEASAIAATIRRLLAWQACLKSRRLGLSKEEQLGLVGELILLRSLAAEIGWLDAVDAWEGPLDGLHDFLRSGTAIEVKCLLGVGNLLHISRLDQLESNGLCALYIARPKLREDVAGKSLPKMISEIRNEIVMSAPGPLSTFNEKLLRVGYLDADAQHYGELTLTMYELCGFEVVEGFPRLTMSTVPSEIVDGSYTIDERAVAAFRLDADRLRAIMRSMSGRIQ